MYEDDYSDDYGELGDLDDDYADQLADASDDGSPMVVDNPRRRRRRKTSTRRRRAPARKAAPRRRRRAPARRAPAPKRRRRRRAPAKKRRRVRRNPRSIKVTGKDLAYAAGGGTVGALVAAFLAKQQNLPEIVKKAGPWAIALVGVAMTMFIKRREAKSVGLGVVAAAAFAIIGRFLAKRSLAAAAAGPTGGDVPPAVAGLGYYADPYTRQRAMTLLGAAPDRMWHPQLNNLGALVETSHAPMSPGVNPTLWDSVHSLGDLSTATDAEMRGSGGLGELATYDDALQAAFTERQIAEVPWPTHGE